MPQRAAPMTPRAGGGGAPGSRCSGAFNNVAVPEPPPSGKETHTVVLSRETDGQFGLEVSLDNVVIAVDLDSAAHKAGLHIKDHILKVDGKALNCPIAELLINKG